MSSRTTLDGGVWCIEYAADQNEIRSVVERGDHHRQAKALVTVGGAPSGYIEFPLPIDELQPSWMAELVKDLSAGSVPSSPPPPPDVDLPLASVIVCTYNRPDILQRCLERLRSLDYPNFEVVVVDNAPRDQRTKDLVTTLELEDPRIRYVVEPSPGLSRARNRGVEAMRGDIGVFTDDDVSVDRRWLREMVAPFVADTSVGCVTGMVCTAEITTSLERYFDARAANWSGRLEAKRYHLDSHDLGPLFPYTPGKFGTGASFGFSRKALADMGPFDVALGAGSLTRGGEDLDAFVKVLLDGYAIYYTPRAIVWHHHRASRKELQRQMYGWGVGLGAFVLAHVCYAGTRPLVLKRMRVGVKQLVATARSRPAPREDSTKNATHDLPRGLMALELLGLAMSPIAYTRARFAARQEVS